MYYQENYYFVGKKKRGNIFSNRREISNQKIQWQLFNTTELKSTLQSSGSTNNDICSVVRKVTLSLAASNLMSVFETLYATSPFSISLFRAYHILISLPNAFLEMEFINPEKNQYIFLELCTITAKKSAVCVENKLKAKSIDIKFRL